MQILNLVQIFLIHLKLGKVLYLIKMFVEKIFHYLCDSFVRRPLYKENPERLLPQVDAISSTNGV